MVFKMRKKKQKKQELPEEIESDVIEAGEMEEKAKQEAPVQPKPITQEEKVFTIDFTETELITRLQFLERSEDMQLFLRVRNGERLFEEHQKLLSELELEKK